MFTKRDHVLGYKTHINQFKRIEIMQGIFLLITVELN